METAVERIVVQTTAQDKRSIAAKAKRLAMPVSELMRRGAFAYESSDSTAELETLADAARDAVDRAARAIDEGLDFIAASDERIARLEAEAAARRTQAA